MLVRLDARPKPTPAQAKGERRYLLAVSSTVVAEHGVAGGQKIVSVAEDVALIEGDDLSECFRNSLQRDAD